VGMGWSNPIFCSIRGTKLSPRDQHQFLVDITKAKRGCLCGKTEEKGALLLIKEMVGCGG